MIQLAVSPWVLDRLLAFDGGAEDLEDSDGEPDDDAELDGPPIVCSIASSAACSSRAAKRSARSWRPGAAARTSAARSRPPLNCGQVTRRNSRSSGRAARAAAGASEVPLVGRPVGLSADPGQRDGQLLPVRRRPRDLPMPIAALPPPTKLWRSRLTSSALSLARLDEDVLLGILDRRRYMGPTEHSTVASDRPGASRYYQHVAADMGGLLAVAPLRRVDYLCLDHLERPPAGQRRSGA